MKSTLFHIHYYFIGKKLAQTHQLESYTGSIIGKDGNIEEFGRKNEFTSADAIIGRAIIVLFLVSIILIKILTLN